LVVVGEEESLRAESFCIFITSFLKLKSFCRSGLRSRMRLWCDSSIKVYWEPKHLANPGVHLWKADVEYGKIAVSR
jgi:hypothetical protein